MLFDKWPLIAIILVKMKKAFIQQIKSHIWQNFSHKANKGKCKEINLVQPMYSKK